MLNQSILGLFQPHYSRVENMLMRLKQFQCFISVLFHHVRRALTFKSRWWSHKP